MTRLPAALQTGLGPVVLLKSTPELDDLILKPNHFTSLKDLTLPFAQHSSPIPRLDSNGQSYTIEDFYVRFQSCLSLSVPTLGTTSIPNLSQSGQPAIIRSREQALETQQDNIDILTPWFASYRDAFLNSFGAEEHETFNHPVAEIYWVSHACMNPLEVLQRMQDISSAPPIYNQLMINMDILRFFVVVHDVQTMDMAKSQELFEAVKRRFGQHVFLLSVNSVPPTSAPSGPNAISDLYAGLLKRNAVDSKDAYVPYGKLMSNQDMTNLRLLVKEFIEKSLIPFMDRSIQLWNEQVASARRGLTSRLFQVGKRYFGSSSAKQSNIRQVTIIRDQVHPPVSTLVYPSQSPEAIMRKLGDFAFLVHDFRFALSIYDNIKKDYQNDRAHRYYAGVQEMIGICSLLTDDRKDVESYYESAMSTYVDQNDLASAFRTGLLYYEVLKDTKNFKDAARAILRHVSADDNLRTALLLEQSAYCYTKHASPLIRKYAFYMVLASVRYQSVDQVELMYRCLDAALCIYKGHHWSLIEDHLNFNIGQYQAEGNELESALECFASVLHQSQQGAAQQEEYLEGLIDIYKSLSQIRNPDSGPLIMENLKFPKCKGSNVKIISKNALKSAGKNANENIPEETWLKMEKDLSVKKNQPVSSARTKHHPEFALHEPIIVIIELQNPLHINIGISGVMLECSFTDDLSTKSTKLSPLRKETESIYQYEGFSVSKISSFQLIGDSSKKISLTIYTEKVGSVQLNSLKFTINNVLQVRQVLEKKGKRINDTAQARQGKEYAADHSLDIVITPPMPLLEVSLDCPKTIYSGEIVRCNLLLKNSGTVNLQNAFVKVSHPNCIVVGEEQQEDRVSGKPFLISNHIAVRDLWDISLISGGLAPGRSTSIPVFVRGDKASTNQLMFLFGYQAEVSSKNATYRLARLSCSITFLPSLKITPLLRTSARCIDEYILGIEAENLHTDRKALITHLSTLSPSWKITPVSEVNNIMEIPPNQTYHTYFRLIKLSSELRNPGYNPEEFVASTLESLITNEPSSVELKPVQVTLSELPLSSDSKHSESAAPVMTRFSRNLRTSWRINHLQMVYSAIPVQKLPSLFALYGSNDVDLIVHWKFFDSQVGGQYFVTGLNLGVQQNPIQMSLFNNKKIGRVLFSQTAKEKTALANNLLRNRHIREENPVKLALVIPENIGHDFKAKRSLIFPVGVRLKNNSWNKEVFVELELLPADSNVIVKDESLGKISNIHQVDFHWIGSTTLDAVLQPNEEKTLKAFATFLKPHVYDMNRWKLTVRTSNPYLPSAQNVEAAFIQMPSLPYFVTVLHESNKKDKAPLPADSSLWDDFSSVPLETKTNAPPSLSQELISF